jgi:hypothetical protein
MSMTAPPVTVGDVQNIQIGMATFTDATAAAAIASQIAAGTTSLNTYANGLVASAFSVASAGNYAPVAITVDNFILGGVPRAGVLNVTTPPINELQNLAINFSGPQADIATKLGLASPTTYVTEQMAQALAAAGDTNLPGSSFASLYNLPATGTVTDAQIQTFAQTLSAQLGLTNTAFTFNNAKFWINNYTANGVPPGISTLSPTIAGLAAAAGDAIGAAIVGNTKGTNFSQQLVFNALADNAEVIGGVKNADGTPVTYQVGKSLTVQQVPVPLQSGGPPNPPNPSIVDMIPNSERFEASQNSEPSIAVNPMNPMQMVASAFPDAYYVSTNGGTTWSPFGTLDHGDTSLAWSPDGSKVLATTLGLADSGANINTFSSTVAAMNFGNPINTFPPIGSTRGLDQPWIETGPANQVYVGYNGPSPPNAPGATAAILVSPDGGNTYGAPITLDRAPGKFFDDPSVREAVNNNTVYVAFDRYTDIISDNADGQRWASQLVVERSDNAGADSFKALGTDGNGVVVATPTVPFAGPAVGGGTLPNTVLTFGMNRSDIGTAIAVNPSNSNDVVVAYSSVTKYVQGQTGVIQVGVQESMDGGKSWTQKFMSPDAIRSGDSSVAILANGAIGLLYDSYDPLTNKLSVHLVTTTNDFKTAPTDMTLAIQTNPLTGSPPQPYLGDYINIVGVGNTFYGVFSALNKDNGTDALINPSNPASVIFQRSSTGTPGTPNFQISDANGAPVPNSIDPFFFKFTPTVPLVGVASPLDHAMV